jgi:hypothetical protein
MKNFALGVMAAVLCIILLGANYQAKPKTYEYSILRTNEFTPDSNLETSMGKLAREKWFVYQVYYDHNDENMKVLYRRVKS